MRPLALLLALLAPVPAAAQWRATLLVGGARVTGHARADDDPDRRAFLPHHASSLDLALDREAGSWRAGIRLARLAADLALLGETAGALVRDALHGWRLGAVGGRTLLGDPDGARLTLLAGLDAERWTLDGVSDGTRSRVAVHATAEVAAPLGGAWRLALRYGVATGASLWREDDLPEGFARRAGRERRWSVGVGREW